MKTKKINLSKFNESCLIARLYVLLKNFNLDNFNTSEELTKHCKILVCDNFILPEKDVKNCAIDLSLFLMGSNNSKFSKLINS